MRSRPSNCARAAPAPRLTTTSRPTNVRRCVKRPITNHLNADPTTPATTAWNPYHPYFYDTRTNNIYHGFLNAYARAREWVRTAPPGEIAAVEAVFFPLAAPELLGDAVRRYQALGCWEGGLEIPRELYEQALNVFQAAGASAWRHRYEEVVG